MKAVSKEEEEVAAMKREEKKEAKYNSELLPESPVIPLAFEILAVGENKVKYLKCWQKVRARDDEMIETEFKKKWRSIISVTLQRCNAKVVSDKLISIARLERRNVVCLV